MSIDHTPLFNFTLSQRREYEKTTLRYTAAAHIQNYLDDSGLRAKDLALRIRKSRAWVSKLLSGHQNATLDTLADVALALGAKWQIDMVAADRIGTPAENDPPPPQRAVHASSTTAMTTSDSRGTYWTNQLHPDIMHMNSYNFYVLVDPHIRDGSNLGEIIGGPKCVIASATASLQFSEVPA